MSDNQEEKRLPGCGGDNLSDPEDYDQYTCRHGEDKTTCNVCYHENKQAIEEKLTEGEQIVTETNQILVVNDENPEETQTLPEYYAENDDETPEESAARYAYNKRMQEVIDQQRQRDSMVDQMIQRQEAETVDPIDALRQRLFDEYTKDTVAANRAHDIAIEAIENRYQEQLQSLENLMPRDERKKRRLITGTPVPVNVQAPVEEEVDASLVDISFDEGEPLEAEATKEPALDKTQKLILKYVKAYNSPVTPKELANAMGQATNAQVDPGKLIPQLKKLSNLEVLEQFTYTEPTSGKSSMYFRHKSSKNSVSLRAAVIAKLKTRSQKATVPQDSERYSDRAEKVRRRAAGKSHGGRTADLSEILPEKVPHRHD